MTEKESPKQQAGHVKSSRFDEAYLTPCEKQLRSSLFDGSISHYKRPDVHCARKYSLFDLIHV
jgi:hypothetical protein